MADLVSQFCLEIVQFTRSDGAAGVHGLDGADVHGLDGSDDIRHHWVGLHGNDLDTLGR